ncbi:hypothetical protein U1Q18_037808 [Sarracenia purpurea var. burkii]
MRKFQTKRVLPKRIQDSVTKSARAGIKPSNRFHSLASPDFDEYEVSFPSLPSRKELSSPKEQKQQAIEPSSHRSIIEEALSLHDNLEALIRDNPMDVKLSEISLEVEVEAYSICPDSLLSEKIEAIEARIQKIKELTSEVETGIVKTLGSESTGLGTEIKPGDVAVWKRSGIGEGPLANSAGDDPGVNAEVNEQVLGLVAGESCFDNIVSNVVISGAIMSDEDIKAIKTNDGERERKKYMLFVFDPGGHLN